MRPRDRRRPRKTHAFDLRLYANAGVRFPVCKANAVLLDMDKTRWPISGVPSEVTCKQCLRILKGQEVTP